MTFITNIPQEKVRQPSRSSSHEVIRIYTKADSIDIKFINSVVVPYCYLFLLSVIILWFTYYVSDIFRKLNDQLPGRELFIRFTARVFRKLLSVYVVIYFPFGFGGGIWGLIISVPDHCLSFYFTCIKLDIEAEMAVEPYELRHDKTNKVSVRPAKTQISLGIRSV